MRSIEGIGASPGIAMGTVFHHRAQSLVAERRQTNNGEAEVARLENALAFANQEPSVVVAEDLAPSDTVTLHKFKVMAFCTATGGPTSHVAILSKALGMPVVVGLGLDEFSMTCRAIPLVKQALRRYGLADTRKIALCAPSLTTSGEVRGYLKSVAASPESF